MKVENGLPAERSAKEPEKAADNDRKRVEETTAGKREEEASDKKAESSRLDEDQGRRIDTTV